MNRLSPIILSGVQFLGLALALLPNAASGQSIFNNQPGKPPPEAQSPARESENRPAPPQVQPQQSPPHAVKEPAADKPDAKVVKDELPADQGVKPARAIVRDLFKDDYRKDDPKSRKALLSKLINQARDSSNDALTQYAILLEIHALATAAGDPDYVILVIDELQRRYPTSSLELQLKLLDTSTQNAQGLEAVAELADCTLAVADCAMWNENYRLAVRAAEQAMSGGRRARAMPVINQAKVHLDLLRELSLAAEAKQHAAADPASNVQKGMSWVSQRKWVGRRADADHTGQRSKAFGAGDQGPHQSALGC